MSKTTVKSMLCANHRVHFGLNIVSVLFGCILQMHALHRITINMQIHIKHFTYKMLVRHILSSLCLWLSPFCHLSLYKMWGGVFSAYSSDDCKNVSTSSYHYHQIVRKYESISITSQYLSHKTMACTVRLAMFLLTRLSYSIEKKLWLIDNLSDVY